MKFSCRQRKKIEKLWTIPIKLQKNTVYFLIWISWRKLTFCHPFLLCQLTGLNCLTTLPFGIYQILESIFMFFLL
jgi:hypothetical protein